MCLGLTCDPSSCSIRRAPSLCICILSQVKSEYPSETAYDDQLIVLHCLQPSPIEFGAHQCMFCSPYLSFMTHIVLGILVRDRASEERLRKAVGNIGIILYVIRSIFSHVHLLDPELSMTAKDWNSMMCVLLCIL